MIKKFREIKTDWSKKGFVGYLDYQWRNPIKQEIAEYRQKMIEYLVKECVELDEPYNIYDCGCGTGLLYYYLPDELRKHYIGLDFTPEMIKHCKKEYKEHEEHFHRVDLLNTTELAILTSKYDCISHRAIAVTQNVIQHITLYQYAVENIMYSIFPDIVLMCERTHLEPTKIVGYNPTRWRFNEDDYYNMLIHLADDEYTVEKLERPKTTRNEDNMLTIFRMKHINL
jgi:SAM-dependent methyltransferase